jgi:Arc/MetJ-type ribon-helix-helix transcriptional regulator
MSEVMIENQQLQAENCQYHSQAEVMREAMEEMHQQLGNAHNQIGQLQQKLHKKVLKHEAKIDDLKEDHAKHIRKLQKEL